jgi:hypothetical protein
LEAEISIHEIIRKRRFEASLITTYNAYLPFYEEVVLKRLLTSGCRYNILLMDRGQFAECLQVPSLRPRLAGFAYTLIPVRAPGAFHPKIVLLVGRKNGALLVGSHNVTLSGFGINRELTTKVEVSTGKERGGLSIAQDAWKFVNGWLETQKGRIPSQLFESMAALKRFAPWLSGKSEPESDGVQFIGAQPSGDSLWQMLHQQILGDIRRAIIVGPFFDGRLEFLQSLRDGLRPKEVIVGVEPDTVHLPSEPVEIENTRFVDASSLYKACGYLHAKAMYIESDSGQSWFVTGSANPSSPAWTAPASSRNAEAVIVQQGEAAKDSAEALGLMGLVELPKLSSDQWSKIEARISTADSDRNKEEAKKETIVAAAVEGGIIFPAGAIDIGDFSEARLLDETEKIIKTILELESVEEDLQISLPLDVSSRVRFVEIDLVGKKSILALVHQTPAITKRSETSRQAQFRRCLASLSSENPDIQNLIRTVEKIIFEDPIEVPHNLRKESKPTITEKEKVEPEEGREIGSLAVHLEETKKEIRRKRLVSSGDIGHLLDVLIHHLGIGLEHSAETVDAKGRSEEEQVGQDDEEPTDGEKELDGKQIVQTCNIKVRNLVSRMLKQMEKATEEDSNHVRPIVQLVAVLAVLRELRFLDQKSPWIPPGATLVPVEERRKLFAGVIRHLFGWSSCILKRALEELIDDAMDEISRLRGLLFWLARECKTDIREPAMFGDVPEAKRNRLLSKYYLSLIIPNLLGDSVATEEADESIKRTTRPAYLGDTEEWLKLHLRWGRAIAPYVLDFKTSKRLDRLPMPGDFAYPASVQEPVLSVVLSAQKNKVTLVDLEKENGQISYLTGHVAVLDVPDFDEVA